MKKGISLFVLCVLVSACGDDTATLRLGEEGPEELARLMVAVESDRDEYESPAFALLSDGHGSFWHDAVVAAASEDRNGSGFFVRGERLLSGWQWWVEADSAYLDSGNLNKGLVRPDFIVRSYLETDTSGFFSKVFQRLQGEKPAGLTERVAMLASVGDTTGVALNVAVSDSLGTVSFFPDVDSQGLIRVHDNTLAVETVSGVWLAITAEEGRAAAGEEGSGPSISLPTPGNVIVAAAGSEQQAVRSARAAMGSVEARREARRRQLVERLESSPFVTEDETFNRAFQWALLTLDALVVRDSARASLMLGLPDREADAAPGVARFLPAFLMTGAWEDARGVLLSLADAQRFDRRIDLLGRAPNAVPPFGDAVFSTTDATPLFLSAAGDVVRTTGDRRLVTGSADFWFKTVFALRGLYEPDTRRGNPVSSEGFLLAREGFGTWADGASPRYGAPVEGQPALLNALQTARDFAGVMGVAERSSSWYADSARVLRERFLNQFVLSEHLLADRLESDGRPVDVVGPSAVVALALLDGMDPEQKARIVRTIAERLGLPHGIATLTQSADAFHPYLDGDGVYSEEDALFSGDVWTWLSGPMAKSMAQTGGEEAAYALTLADAKLILNRGTIGAIPERLAGHPRSSSAEPEMGGAPVQPFSLAGFLQAAYEGYLGARYVSSSELVIAPRLPEAWGETEVAMRLGGASVTLRLEDKANRLEADILRSGTPPEGARIRLVAQGREILVPLTSDSVSVAITEDGAQLNGELFASTAVESVPASVWDGFSWSQVALREAYPVLQVAETRSDLEPSLILRDNPGAAVILTQTDPSGDDWGATSTFTYPRGFAPGVLDGTYLEVARDDSTTFFQIELAAPPEGTGFPFLAVALDVDEGGERDVGYGAGYRLSADRGYEYVILLGDGIRVIDARGRELGGLAPGHSAIDPASGVVSFALPDFLVPPLERGTRVTVLIGARDVSQGAGAFRAVAEGPSGELGGGRVDRAGANIYDVISGRVSQ